MNRQIAVGFAALVLTGCSANWSAVHYTRDLTDKQSLITDASQRAIIHYPELADATPRKSRIICAEPSPDVAFALSQALSAALSVGKVSPDPAEGLSGGQRAVNAQLGSAAVSSVAQLGERLAVIQLLRDKMFRACEAYANRAITNVAYTVMLARHDKTMTALLSGELAAGAFGRTLARIGGTAGAGGVDRAAIEKQQDTVKKLAEEIKGLDPTKADDQKKLKPKAEELGNELMKLYGMELTAASATAAGSIAGGDFGSIAKMSIAGSPEAVARIHRDYADDDGTEPLTDACIVALEQFGESDGKKLEALQASIVGSARERAEAESLTQRTQNVDSDIEDLRGKVQRLEREVEVKQAARVAVEQGIRDTESKLQAAVAAKPAPGTAAPSADDEAKRLRAERGKLEGQRSQFDSEIKAAQQEINRTRQAVEEKRKQQDELEVKRAQADAVAQGRLQAGLIGFQGGALVSMCLHSVVGGSSFYLNRRMKQKRQLRELSAKEVPLSAEARAMDLCRAVITDTTLPKEEKAKFVASCSGLVGSLVGAQSSSR